MMEYAKVILPAVCGWEELFRKELVKCLKWADSDEKMRLYQWCSETFFDEHPEILAEAFACFA